MTDKELLDRITRAEGERAGFKQLVRETGLRGGEERRDLMEQLLRLTKQGQRIPAERGRWAVARAGGTRENLIAGRLSIHRDGYGFVRVSDTSGVDVFIPAHSTAGAMQGDQVLVEVGFGRDPNRDSDRREGRVLRVLTRRNPTIVGIFHYARDERAAGHRVVAFDEKITQPVIIRFDSPLPEAKAMLRTPHRVLGEEAALQIATYPDLEGLVVDVEVTEWPTDARTARGRVIEVLGRQDDFGVDVEMVIRKHQLPRVFPDGVLAEAAKAASDERQVTAARRDFRDRTIVTIDGETARDFDDAVEVRAVDDGWELDVHIADVAEYVQAGTLLDLEARLRGTSVYFPDRAIPMLPQELSTGICSLKPDEDRLVLSCLMRIDARGEIASFEVCEGVIRSARRMTYTAVAACLDGNTEGYEALAPRFEEMQRLAQALNRKRVQRGSIDFDLPEPAIEFDEQGAMQGVRRAERNWAHRLIEEFMLAANESVASWLSSHAPALYRIHEKPDPRRILDFEDIAAGFGYSLGIGNLPVKRFAAKNEGRERRGAAHPGRARTAHEVPDEIPVTPRMYQQLARRLEGKPEERILHYLMLRSLKQARYAEENEGHFALAASFYTHFTSPIRRYPDLIVHRVAKALLRAGVSGQGELRLGEPAAFDGAEGPVPLTELTAIGTESSETERRADAAERELVEWKKIRFMAGKVGEEFDGLILNATKYGLFVELTDLFVEGLVPIGSLSELDGDRYTYRENTREIIGEVWARRFRVGQKVRVLLERVNAVEKRLLFGIILSEGEQTSKPRLARPGKKRKIPAPKGFGKKKRRK